MKELQEFNLSKVQTEIALFEKIPGKIFPKIDSEERLSRASNYLSRIKKVRKTIWDKFETYDVKFKKQKQSINEMQKMMKGDFAKIDRPYEFAESCIKEEILAYYKQEEIKALEAVEAKKKEDLETQKRMVEEAKMLEKAKTPEEKKELEEFLEETKPKTPAELPVIAPKTSIKTNEGTSYVIKSWKFKIVNPAMVEHQYLMINEAKIKEAIKNGARGDSIPGVEIYEESTLGNRPA